jgi:hypothetical protein
MVVGLALDDHDVADVVDMILPEGEESIGLLIDVLPDDLEISVERTRGPAVVYFEEVVGTLDRLTLFQQPFLLATELVLILPRRQIQSCMVCIRLLVVVQSARMLPVVPTTEHLAALLALVADQEGLKLRFVHRWWEEIVISVKLTHFCHLDLFGVELVETFGRTCEGTHEGQQH